MKKATLFLLALLLPLVANAGPVTTQQALLKAQQFMQGKTFTAAQSRRMPPRQGNSADAAFYVFNAAEGGYAIVSGDDRTLPILGYSQNGRLDMDQLPEHIQSWLDSYADQIAYLQQHPEAQVAQNTLGNVPAIAPLLGETEWNQRSPYNDLCPMDGNNRSVTGCVATAMAQIMYYHKWPAQTTAEIPGYTTGSQNINVDAIPAGTTIDWDNMLPQYSYYGAETDAQKQAVAQLMLMCGTSIKMEYSADGSGAQTDDVAEALKKYFDYDATAKGVDRLDYRLAEWNQLIYDELATGRPVEYSGSPVLPSVMFSPHAFVIDGYDKDDFFHVNWGWGGSFNGFFLLSVLDYYDQARTDPFSNNDSAYTLNQLAVIGIQKNIDSVIVPGLTTTKVSINESGTQLTRNSAETNFQVSVNFSYDNETDETGTFETSIGLFDSNDQLLSLVTSVKKETINGHSSQWHVYNTVFGAGLPNGSYTLKAIHRLVGTTEWKVNHGSDRYYIIVNINDNNLELKNASDIAIEMNVELTGEIKVGNTLSVAATIKNKGITNYNNELFLLVDNRCYIGGIIELNAGESKTLNFSFTPTEPGEKTISLNTRTYKGEYKWDYHPICNSTTIVVPVPDGYCLKSTMEAEQEQNGVVTDYNLKLNVHVSNLGRGTYDGKVKIEELNSHKEIIQPIVIDGGQETELQIVFDELDDGRCKFYLYYWEDGEWKDSSVSLWLTYKRGEPIAKTYAIYNNGTLTLYYDKNSDYRHGVVYDLSGSQSWRDVRELITKVVFDPSFAEARLQSVSSWFNSCKALEVIDGISYLNTSEVTDMSYMFSGCSSLTSLDVSKFNTENVTDMSYMFKGCSSLTSLDVSKFNTQNVTDMSCMFNDCSGLTNLDVSKFNTQNVTDMRAMFSGCSSITSLDVSKFNTQNVTHMFSMFRNCSGLTNLDVSKFNTENVTDMKQMFYGCRGLAIVDVSKFDTHKVKDMNSMFMSCKSLVSLGISNINTQNVTDMGLMFYGCSSLTSLEVSKFNTQNVTNMSQMFMDCSSLTSLDVSNFNTENITTMSSMFSGCSSLTSLDVSNFNTENVTTMSSMFSGCSSLTSLDVSNFNTENVTTISSMFSGCSSLTSLDVSNLNTQNVTTMRGLFYNCSSLSYLDLSSFNTAKIEDFDLVFGNCNSLTHVSLGYSFTTTEDNTFYGCFPYNNSIARVSFTGDVPQHINRGFFFNVGKSSPATLEVPQQYLNNFAARFVDGKFYGGYFTLSGSDVEPSVTGDLNGDGEVNSTDLVIIVNMIMGRQTKTNAADLNGDGEVNSTDLVMLVNIIMNK